MQWYTQVEGVDFDKTLAPIARLESIHLLLAIACHVIFELFQMDVNNAFLNDILHEEAMLHNEKALRILSFQIMI